MLILGILRMPEFSVQETLIRLDAPMTRKTERFSSRARERLSAVLQTAKDLVTIEDAMKALSLERHAAAKVLSRWQYQGWLKRVGRGIYAPIPLDASTTEQVLKDPWVLVPALFAPRVRWRLDGRRTLGSDRTAFQ